MCFRMLRFFVLNLFLYIKKILKFVRIEMYDIGDRLQNRSSSFDVYQNKRSKSMGSSNEAKSIERIYSKIEEEHLKTKIIIENNTKESKKIQQLMLKSKIERRFMWVLGSVLKLISKAL